MATLSSRVPNEVATNDAPHLSDTPVAARVLTRITNTTIFVL